QLLPAGGRGPVHAAQRLAALVLPDAVQLEAGRSAQEHPARAVRAKPALGEQGAERCQSWKDEERTGIGQLLVAARQPEGPEAPHVGGGEAVPAAQNVLHAIRRTEMAAVASRNDVALAEPSRRIVEHDASGGHSSPGPELG